MRKIVLQGKEAREKLKKGVDLCANIVGSTMGPWGRSVAIEWIGEWPYYVDDGVTVAKSIEVDDETENLGVLTIVNTATKTDDEAGDGTTTTVVIAQKIIDEVFNKMEDEGSVSLGNKTNVVECYKEINRVCGEVLAEIDKRKKIIETKEDLEKVAIVSAKDEKLGKMIADMVWKLGKDAYIAVEDSYLPGIEAKVIDGFHFYGKPAADFMLNERKEAEMTNVPILITTHKIESLAQFLRSAEKLDFFIKDLEKQKVMELVIIAPDFGNEALLAMFNNQRVGFRTLAIRAKSLTSEQLEDIAFYTNAKMIDLNKGDKLNKVSLEELGRADRVLFSKDKVAVIGGKGSKEQIETRIAGLKDQLKKEEDDMFRKKLERRISSLSGGIGVLKIGLESNIKQNYLLKKAEDAKNATRGAMEDGYVKGGGLCLKEIAESMPENILTKALSAPYFKIQENAGGELLISDDVIDAAKVIKVALKNACSVAGTFIMADSSIANRRKNLLDDLQATIPSDHRFEERLPTLDAERRQKGYGNSGDY